MTSAIVAGIPAGGGDGKGEKPPDILKAITKPFTSVVIQIDKKVLLLNVEDGRRESYTVN